MTLHAITNKTQIFCEEKLGVTSIEYALIASLIAVAIIVSVGATGDQVEALYNTVAEHLTL